MTRTCPDCSGTGEVDDEQCRRCLGLGRVFVDQVDDDVEPLARRLIRTKKVGWYYPTGPWAVRP